jgi:hypothetical protein
MLEDLNPIANFLLKAFGRKQLNSYQSYELLKNDLLHGKFGEKSNMRSNLFEIFFCVHLFLLISLFFLCCN